MPTLKDICLHIVKELDVKFHEESPDIFFKYRHIWQPNADYIRDELFAVNDDNDDNDDNVHIATFRFVHKRFAPFGWLVLEDGTISLIDSRPNGVPIDMSATGDYIFLLVEYIRHNLTKWEQLENI